MSDLIRREDVYDVLKKVNIAEMPIYLFDKLWNAVRTLPSAEPEEKWIPVTEALPEEEKELLASMDLMVTRMSISIIRRAIMSKLKVV